jgi:hypothetical protein
MAGIPTVREQSENTFTLRSLKPQNVATEQARQQQTESPSAVPTAPPTASPTPSPSPSASPSPKEQVKPNTTSPTPTPGPNSQKPAQPNPSKPNPPSTPPKQEFAQESDQSPDNATNKAATPLSDQQIVEKVAQQGVPREAIERVVTFLKTTATHTLTVKADSVHLQDVRVGNRVYASIIDYSKRSSEHLAVARLEHLFLRDGL